MRKFVSAALCASLAAWACGANAAQPFSFLRRQIAPAPAAPKSSFVDIPYATFSPNEPAYRLYFGDEIEITFPTALQYNKVLTVRPDGRITLPITNEEIMAAGRTMADIRADVANRMRTQLRTPSVEMQVKTQPIKVYVGGEVNAPGEYELVGDADSLQAILKAGGYKDTANMREVRIIRRAPDGQLHDLKLVDLAKALRHGEQPDLVPLARQDIIYVPKTGLANIGNGVQQFLRALPIQLNYSINGFR